jgi:hypothetical protein
MVQAAVDLYLERLRNMADSQNKLRVGPDSFWHMTAVAMEGRLASCESCLGLYYFNSELVCRLYLEACSDAGLVERYSLLELKAEADLNPAAARKRYDQAIYISAPRLRQLNPDLARRKAENTANAVYKAFFIYHELLAANDAAINAAYEKAVEEGSLRNPQLALSRRDVRLSSITQLRLILDGFKNKEIAATKERRESEQLSSSEIEKRATDQTVEYILSMAGSPAPDTEEKSDRGYELDKFITGFLVDPFRLKEFSGENSPPLPDGFHAQLLLLISELCRHRYDVLSHDRTQADKFVRDIRNAIEEAKVNYADDQNYLAALSDFAENLNSDQLPAVPFVSAIRLGSTFESVSF